jgi:hypothetical protein
VSNFVCINIGLVRSTFSTWRALPACVR